MNHDKLAVAIFAFQRPEYLKRCLASLELQQEVGSTSWYVFQDGAVNRFSNRRVGDPVKTRESLTMAMSWKLMPQVHVEIGDVNLGTALQRYNAYDWLFKAGYRWVAVLEEDVVVSPHYLKICRILMEMMAEDEKCFSATPSFMRYNTAEHNIPLNIGKYEIAPSPWVGYVMDLSKWPAVRETFQPYYHMIKNVDYGQRPHVRIREWYKTMGWPSDVSSQDGAMECCLNHLGMHRYRCMVNRGFYIGVEGTHGRQHVYDRQGWADHKPYIHDYDDTITELEFSAT